MPKSDVANVQSKQIEVKVKIAAHSFDNASNSVKGNLLYILDTLIEPVHLSDESTIDIEVTQHNTYPHTVVE